MEFWQRVKEFIKSQKLTQERLCKSCDISLATFVSWIHNDRLPDLDSAIKIAKFLNTSAEYLVTGKDDNIYKQKYENIKSDIDAFIEKVEND